MHRGMSAVHLRFETLRGDALREWLPRLAGLRIAVFRAWPYLYEGEAAYEERYLAAYADSPKAHREQDLADRCFTVAAQATARSLAELPSHRDLLDRIRTYGLQPV